jgi:hypothetical protein
MKYTVTIIFGKEQVSKIFNSENLTNEELKLHKKVYSFDTFIEKEAFIKGIEESIGWSECYVC